MKEIGHFLKLVWKVSPLYILLLIFQSIITCAQSLLNLYLLKLLVDALTTSKDLHTIMLYGLALVANTVVITWLNNLLKRFLDVKIKYVDSAMRKEMAIKIMNLEYSYLEDPYYLDLKERALFALNNQGAIQLMITLLAQILSNIVTIIGLVAILVTLGWVLPVAMLVAIILSLLAMLYMSGNMVKVMNKILPVNRKMTYYLELMMEKQYQKDIRLYNMSDMITDRAVSFTNDFMDEFGKFYDVQGNVGGFTSGLNALISAFAYAYVGLRTISDKLGPQIGIGSLTMYVSAVIDLFSVFTSLCSSVSEMFGSISFLQPYIEFMSLAEETKSEGKEIFTGPVETLEFRDVSFTYPKAQKPVLTHVSFTVNRGEKISIVGLNGAGKSTLVKLICRMYKADGGEILVNGKNIYDYDYMSYMKEISAVFQDFKIFNFSIQENISCQQEKTNVDEVNRLIDEVGMRDKVDELPNGIQTLFGKEYDEDGIEMSGGQAQKIAIARALYKEASMVILDEPASALDPIAEAEIYEKFNGLVNDKTAIYISHRMSSSVFCDKILIIDGGSVSDFDTHEHLMAKTDSLYYKLFMAQAENYALD